MLNRKMNFRIPIIGSLLLFSGMIGGCDKESPDSGKTLFAEITNARIAYKTYGAGDPLLLCMGYASNMDSWSTEAIEILQEKYRVIVFDYRGMGYSTNTGDSFTINTLAEDVNELLIALDIEKTHVLGWSMGGYVAQIFAINHPDKLNKLILYATNCGDTIAINPSQEIIDILSDPSSSPMDLLGTLFPDEWLASHPEPWTFLPDAKEPFNGETIGMQYGAVQEWLSPGGGSSGRLKELAMPVLLICGDQDKIVPSINSTILGDSIRTSSLIKVNGTGHGLMYQLPETFANYILSFLGE